MKSRPAARGSQEVRSTQPKNRSALPCITLWERSSSFFHPFHFHCDVHCSAVGERRMTLRHSDEATPNPRRQMLHPPRDSVLRSESLPFLILYFVSIFAIILCDTISLKTFWVVRRVGRGMWCCFHLKGFLMITALKRVKALTYTHDMNPGT